MRKMVFNLSTINNRDIFTTEVTVEKTGEVVSIDWNEALTIVDSYIENASDVEELRLALQELYDRTMRLVADSGFKISYNAAEDKDEVVED